MSAPSVYCDNETCERSFLVFGPDARPGASVRCPFCRVIVKSTNQPFEDEIGPPPPALLRFIRGLRGFSFLNRWTMPTFTAQVRERFGRKRS